MPAFITSTISGIQDAFRKLGKTARIVVVSSAALAFVALIVFAILASRGPEYGVLWSNLSPEDAGTIINQLEKDGIPYQLADGGTTIKVPKDSLYKTRISLASQGIPSSGIVGFESIGQGSIWATDFERKVQYVRALQGELARTIKDIQGVEDCRVHIVLPDPSVFSASQKPPTAAVLVKMSGGQEMSPLTVRGIINLVSRSVEGLSPENVTVLDSQGELLSQDAMYGSDSTLGLSGTVLELTAKTEQELEKRLTAFLTPVLGAGNVVCQVRAELNMDQVKTTDTKYTTDPQGGILRSAQETQEQYKGQGTPAGGTAGGLDVPSYATSGSGQSEYQRTDVTRNYEVNQTVTETLVSPGSIKRLSVSVVVNKELDDNEKTAIQEAVSAALGLDPKRQDQISVTGMLFDTSLAKSIQESFTPQPQTFPRIYIYAAAGAGALILGTIILLLLRRRKASQEETEAPLPPVLTEEAPSVSPELLARQKARENVERLVRSNPQLAANLIKSWLLEDQR